MGLAGQRPSAHRFLRHPVGELLVENNRAIVDRTVLACAQVASGNRPRVSTIRLWRMDVIGDNDR